MGQVSLVMNGRSYRFACGDGEEVRTRELGEYLRAKVEDLASEFGQVGNERLILMAAMLIADELFDAREACDAALEEAAEAMRIATEPASSAERDAG
jgi:cell division protein ZapA